MFDVGPLRDAAVHLMNSLLTAALVVEGACAWRTARAEQAPRAFDLFSIAILPNVLHGALRQDVRSLSTDAAVCAVLFAATRVLFDALAHPAEARDERWRRMAMVLLLFTAAVTVKLSAAGVAAASVLVALWSLSRRGDARLASWSQVSRWVAPSVVLLVGWLVRGVLLSGYPLYPAALFPMSVDWRVPAEQVAGEAAWITMSARNLNTNVIYPGMSWVLPWIRGVVLRGDPFVQLTLPTLLIAGCSGAALWTRRRMSGPPWHPSWRTGPLAIGAGLAFWLATAPHTRMAQGPLWSAAAIAMAWWVSGRSPQQGRTPAARLALLVVVITSVITVKQAAGVALRADRGSRMRETVAALLTLPRNGVWMAPFPKPQLREVGLASGVRIVVPVLDNACWSTRLVCTPHPSASLALRQPNGALHESVSHGFRSAGGVWTPERWPNPWTPFLAWWRCTRSAAVPGAVAGKRCLASVSVNPAPPAAPGSPH